MCDSAPPPFLAGAAPAFFWSFLGWVIPTGAKSAEAGLLGTSGILKTFHIWKSLLAISVVKLMNYIDKVVPDKLVKGVKLGGKNLLHVLYIYIEASRQPNCS